ncbi:MAG: HDOD domain-containing protein [Phycisphaerae bacterium]
MSVQTAGDTNKIVDKALAAIGDIATLPEVTIKIIQIVEDPKSTARDLHDVIKNDPALSVKVLKVVNSAFYGLPGQIASVDRAIVLLGLSAVKNIAVAASIAKLFKGKRISERFSASDLWRHNVAVAVTARAIAKLAPNPAMLDEIFVAGLIHDLGVLVERQAFPDQLAEIINHCTHGDVSFLAYERRLLGADHQAFGVGLTTKWRFPRHLRAAVGFHHNPEALSAELRNIGTVMHVADIMSCQEMHGFYITAQGETITDDALDVLEITRDQLESVRTMIPELVAEAESTLD